MIEKSESKAIVIGGDHINTLGVIRSLGEKKVPVYLIIHGDHAGYTSKSKYIKKTFISNGDEKNLISILKNNFNNSKSKKVIFPTSDKVLEILSRNKENLKNKYIIPSINKKGYDLNKIMDKEIMNKLAKESGLNVPKTWKVNLPIENKEISNIDFPCIVKPLNSIDGKKDDIVICYDKESLNEELLKLSDNYNEILIQEYINSPNEKMIGVLGCRTKKETIIPGVIEKIREFPKGRGSISFAKLSEDSTLINIDQINQFLNDLDYYGVFDMDFIHVDGQTYFIEINLRNGAQGYAITKAGTNVPFIWYLDAIGKSKDTKIESNKIPEEFYFMREISDFRNVLDKNISFFEWIRSLLKTKSFLFLSIKDMFPIFSRILNI